MARLRTARPKTAKRSAAKPRRRHPQRPPPLDAAQAALATFAHDFRTVLTGILALGELLASSNLGERERRWALGIKDSAEHLAALTTLVIEAAKAGRGRRTLQQDVFRPGLMFQSIAASLAARAEAKGLEVAVRTGDLPELLIGDPVRLRAALENLVDNAVKFTARGTVRLEAHAAPAPRRGRGKISLMVDVIDSGIGLSRAEIKRLFRPFAQASPDIALRYGGAGLGLAVVKHLAEAMGGNLTVQSRQGRGSTFRFTAVLAVADATAAAPAQASPSPASARRLAILCAEDNPYGRVILNTILTELGHRADFVGSGEEAVEAVARGYDVVLMDVTLPGADGLEATRRIRALGGPAARTPIVGITGRSERGDEAAGRAAGMDFYLRKPLSPSTLSQVLAAAIVAGADSENL